MTHEHQTHLETVADFIDWLVDSGHLICRWHETAGEWKPITIARAEDLVERFLVGSVPEATS